jgi:hypothetical protein
MNLVTDQDKIELILAWAEGKDHFFDTAFVQELQGKLERYGKLTERQQEALDNIIEKFEID